MIPAPAVAAISAAILAYEVLLVRLFAIVQWYHFAFMAISVALLGFGISGALLAVCRGAALRHAPAAFTVSAVVFAATAPLAFLLAQRLPFNALEVVWAPSQLLYLGAIYLLLAVPFTAGGAGIGLALMAGGTAVGRVYLWNLLGSGVGALGVIAMLRVLSPIACLGLVGVTGLGAAAIAAHRIRGFRPLLAVALLAVIGGAGWQAAPSSWLALSISEFKGLTRALATQDARLVREYSGPLAHLSVVESPTVPFRYAPGLSLQAPALPPPQLGIFADGEFAAAIDVWDGRVESLAYLDHSTDALAYHLSRRPEVLVLGAGAGRAVLQALGHQASGIDAVELNPDMIRLVREDFARVAGGVYDRPGVKLHVADARRFLEAAQRSWNAIHLPLLGGGPSAVALGLNEDYLLTVEAFRLMYRRLRPDGWLSVTSRLEIPPRTVPKLVATIRSALSEQGAVDPSAQVIVIRGMTTVTVLVKRGPVSAGDIEATRTFARERAFDLVHYPGMPAGEANTRNVLAGPVYYQAVSAMLGPGRDAFIDSYKFDIAPATDDRPFFQDLFKWTSLPEMLALGPARGAALLDLGELIVGATLVQAVVLSVLLVLLPLRTYRSRQRGETWRYGVYFTALGLAFLFVEMAWIQKFVLFLGHPLYSVSVVLTGFLIFAGLGAGASEWLQRRAARAGFSAIDIAIAGIAAVALGYLAVLPSVFEGLSGVSDAGRVVVSLGLIAPLAFFMGMPFPLGLARVARTDPEFVPWAWGLNGCASVISAAAATLLTMHLGFSATVVIAVSLYLLAALAMRGDRAAV